MQTNRKYKDSVFSCYLSEPKRLIEIYNAVEGADYPLDTPVTINTLDHVLYMDRVNDLSFVLDGKLIVLIEHQSTINENMALRMLLYVGRLYEKYLDGDSLYRMSQIQIPTPVFIVLYNGEAKLPERFTQRLSTAYLAQGGQLDLTVQIININFGKSRELINRSRSLEEYSLFVHQVREAVKQGTIFEEAVKQAIRYCINHDIMKEFLMENGSEVENMLFQEWNMERALEVRAQEAMEKGMQKGMEKGMQKGMQKGIAEAQSKLVRNMAQKLKPEEIADITGIELAQIQAILSVAENQN